MQEKRRKNKKEDRWVRRGGRAGGSLCECNRHQTFDTQPFTKNSRDAKTREKKKILTHYSKTWGHPCGRVSYSPATTGRALLRDGASALNDSVRPSSLTPCLLSPSSKANSPKHSQTRNFNFQKNKAIWRVEHNFPQQENSIRRQFLCPNGLCSPYMI